MTTDFSKSEIENFLKPYTVATQVTKRNGKILTLSFDAIMNALQSDNIVDLVYCLNALRLCYQYSHKKCTFYNLHFQYEYPSNIMTDRNEDTILRFLQFPVMKIKNMLFNGLKKMWKENDYDQLSYFLVFLNFLNELIDEELLLNYFQLNEHVVFVILKHWFGEDVQKDPLNPLSSCSF